jgi:gamma-glutamyltranspeptidase/glutathione hydrolase
MISEASVILSMKKLHFYLIFAIVLFPYCHSTKKAVVDVNPYQFTIQKKIVCENGAVVSAHPLASQVGIEILKLGGNAIDAAIATQLALAVVYPIAGNLGGGGFMVASLSNGKLIALDYREMAPLRADRDMYLDEKGNVQPDKSVNGHLASGVPGTVAGLFASAKYGKLPFKRLIQPAIDLAERGFTLTEREARSFNYIQEELKTYNTVMPVFLKQEAWKIGDTLIQTELANTLKRIRDAGEKGFYEGETARLIVEEMRRGGGIITPQDLKSYKAKFREAHVFDYKGYRIVGMPMPSSGGILVNQMMKMIENKNIAAMGFQSPSSVQLMTEVERRAYADRAEYMGDEDFYKVPVKMLVSDEYLLQRMKDYEPGVAGNIKNIKPGMMPHKESKETTHLSVMDKQGNAVAVTTTLNNSYGSKTVIAGAGFFLNDEMDDFSAKPGVPNLYGAIGGEANAIAPGKRMLSSMTPTLVLKADTTGVGYSPYIVLGTPGGTTIPTSVFQTLVNILEFNMTTEDAVYKPKFHHQWMPDTLELENGFPQNVQLTLQNMGYLTKQRSSIGRTEVIKVLPDGKFEAVADNRGDDDARGY